MTDETIIDQVDNDKIEIAPEQQVELQATIHPVIEQCNRIGTLKLAFHRELMEIQKKVSSEDKIIYQDLAIAAQKIEEAAMWTVKHITNPFINPDQPKIN